MSEWVAREGGGSHTPTHCDEAICGEYHFSCVLHLDTQGDGFEGGDLVFSDEPGADSGGGEGDASAGGERVLTRLSPQRGRALLFTSGWENLHYVDAIASGVRHALVTFFMTRAAWARDGEDDVRGPVAAEDVADALLHFVLRAEDAEDEGQFTALWHSMFAAPLADG